MRDWRTNNWRCELGCAEYDDGCDACRWRLEAVADELGEKSSIEWWTLYDCRDSCHPPEIFRLGYRTKEEAISVASDWLKSNPHDLEYMHHETTRLAEPVEVEIEVDGCTVIGRALVESREVRRVKRTESIEHEGETFSRQVEDVEVVRDWAVRTETVRGKFPNYEDREVPRKAVRRIYVEQNNIEMWRGASE